MYHKLRNMKYRKRSMTKEQVSGENITNLYNRQEVISISCRDVASTRICLSTTKF